MYVKVYRFISITLLIFLIIGVPANAKNPEPGSEDDADTELPPTRVVYYDINRNLTLNCSLTSTDSTLAYVWKKNKMLLQDVPELNGRYKLEKDGASFKLSTRATENDYGNYSCSLGDQEMAWEVHGRPVARLPDNAKITEGQKLELQCKVTGKPYPVVTWTYQASEDSDAVPLVGGGRVTLNTSEQGVENASLAVDSAQYADAGIYSCHAGEHGISGQITIRIRDMYAALWPFLGICAEVLVLAVIILVYERRRTKPELDDSDTDHDQKKP